MALSRRQFIVTCGSAGLVGALALRSGNAAFAELQQFLPGLLRTERPRRLILDRRPFL